MSLAAALARGLGAPLRVGEVGAPLRAGEVAPARLDAIVVLGAPVSASGLGAVVAERVAAGRALWQAGGAPLICVTGGDTRPGCNEADAMAEALLAGGVPAAVLRRERDARSTDDNARLSAALLAADGVRTVWVVTQPFHGRRARRCFRRAGLDARIWPVVDGLEHREPSRALRWIAREYAAWLRELARSPKVAPTPRRPP